MIGAFIKNEAYLYHESYYNRSLQKVKFREIMPGGNMNKKCM